MFAGLNAESKIVNRVADVIKTKKIKVDPMF